MPALQECMRSIDELSRSTFQLPFKLPRNTEAQDWFIRLEFVDVVEGSIEQLEQLAAEAPSESARRWLLKQLARRMTQ